jgi:hypothetical protein
MLPPYTIRRRVSDYRWEYLSSENWRYGNKFRATTKEKAEQKLKTLPENEKWEISCCGA